MKMDKEDGMNATIVSADWRKVTSTLHLIELVNRILDYIDTFGDLSCCFEDCRPFLHHFLTAKKEASLLKKITAKLTDPALDLKEVCTFTLNENIWFRRNLINHLRFAP
jgi:hypothetical protein